jgi:hypothetical protein
VIDSQVDGRGQTWAFIEIVECPAAKNPTLAMSSARPVIR